MKDHSAPKSNSFPQEMELVEGCRKGNRKAQKLIYQTFGPKMLMICLRYVGSKDAAKDVLHEAFIKIFDKIHQFKGNSGLYTWMCRIAINECLQQLKKEKKLSWVELKDQHLGSHEDAQAEEDLWSNLSEQKLELDRTLACIGKLPDGYRTILNLYAIEGFSHKEIAKELEISESTSKSQLSRARVQLKKLIAIND